MLDLLNVFTLLNYYFYEIFFNFLNFFDPSLNNGMSYFNNKIYFCFPQNLTFFFMLKFCLSIAFLILIRGGTPRYRYDYLTKLGWLKFIGLTILVFFLSMFLIFLF